MDPTNPHHSQVCVVIIGYNDADRVTDPVRSALAQGPTVREVLAVDGCSADGSADLLDRLAADETRVKVIHRADNGEERPTWYAAASSACFTDTRPRDAARHTTDETGTTAGPLTH